MGIHQIQFKVRVVTLVATLFLSMSLQAQNNRTVNIGGGTGGGSDNAAIQVSGSDLQVLDGGGTVSVPLDQVNFELVEERFTGITGTAITITVGTPTADPADLIFYRNGLQQEPGVDFTIAGTNITLTVSAVAAERFIVKFREE